jgi:hypothetical protein
LLSRESQRNREASCLALQQRGSSRLIISGGPNSRDIPNHGNTSRRANIDDNPGRSRHDGRAAAKAKGVGLGRKRKLSAH